MSASDICRVATLYWAQSAVAFGKLRKLLGSLLRNVVLGMPLVKEATVWTEIIAGRVVKVNWLIDAVGP